MLEIISELITDILDSREVGDGQGSPSVSRLPRRSFWTIVFGNMYWNRRHVVPDHINERIIADFTAENEEDDTEDKVTDVTDVLEPMTRRRQIEPTITTTADVVEDEDEGVDVGVVDQQDMIVNQRTEIQVNWVVETVKDFDGEPLRKVKRRMYRKYETILLYKLREKFRWASTPRTVLNDSAIHHYVVSLMIKDHVRTADRHRILATIVDRFYTPLRSDIESTYYSKSVVGSDLRRRVTETVVEENWQRFIGLGDISSPGPQIQ
jgi:hypothetical protein